MSINTKHRDKIFNKFKYLFGNEIAILIEKSIYRYSVEYAENNDSLFLLENIYNGKVEELYHMLEINLQNSIKAFKNDIIKPINIAFMTQNELNILISNKQYIDVLKRKELDMMLNEKKGSSAFECNKCHQRNSSVVEKQILSGDEPATQFITCLECGNVVMNGYKYNKYK